MDKEEALKKTMGDDEGENQLRELERGLMLQALDRHWMDHLSGMDYLREGIGWRGYAGIDPLVLYKKEAYDMFQQTLGSMQEEVVTVLFRMLENVGNEEDEDGEGEIEADEDDAMVIESIPV